MKNIDQILNEALRINKDIEDADTPKLDTVAFTKKGTPWVIDAIMDKSDLKKLDEFFKIYFMSVPEMKRFCGKKIWNETEYFVGVHDKRYVYQKALFGWGPEGLQYSYRPDNYEDDK